MLSFSEKYPVSIQSGRQYAVSFEIIIHTTCELFADFYVYPQGVGKEAVDGQDITVEILESGAYTVVVDAPEYDGEIPNAYFRLWNLQLPLPCVQVSNVRVESIDNLTNRNQLFDSKSHISKQNLKELDLSLVTTWNCHCGIATYSKHLLDGLQKIDPLFNAQVVPVNEGVPKRVNGKVVHLQHEWGIFPIIPMIGGKCILTWHSVARKEYAASTALGKLVDIHIVHSKRAKDALSLSINSDKIHVIPHGSFEFPDISKQAARELLELPLDKFIVFVFGMRANFKGYEDIIPIDSDNLLILVSSGPHGKESQQLTSKFNGSLKSTKCTKFLNNFLSEMEVTLYALAADAFIFNYKPPNNCISASGALHRVVGAGRPIICTDMPQFDELEHQKSAFKIKDGSDISGYINVLMKNDQLAIRMGDSARKVANDTSWDKIAKMHMELYA